MNNELESFNSNTEVSFAFVHQKAYFNNLFAYLNTRASDWLKYWIMKKPEDLSGNHLPKQNKIVWLYTVALPFLTDLENTLKITEEPLVFGLSGLPGSGKSFLGKWIDEVANKLQLPIKVISLDDFYLPGDELEISMKGNPWSVPRGLPGSHSTDLILESLEMFKKTGIISCPQFDKSLRSGFGDRSGWHRSNQRILVLEGWFLGCRPLDNDHRIYYLNDEPLLSPKLTSSEIRYREIIQHNLIKYQDVWNMFYRLWNLKAKDFKYTSSWKRQQELEMLARKGNALKGSQIDSFIRMIQSCIPQISFLEIKSDVDLIINQEREVIDIIINI